MAAPPPAAALSPPPAAAELATGGHADPHANAGDDAAAHAAASAVAVAVAGTKRGRAQMEVADDTDDWLLDYNGDDDAYDAAADAEVTALLEADGLLDAAFMAAHVPKRFRPSEQADATDSDAAGAAPTPASRDAAAGGSDGGDTSGAAAYAAIDAADVERRVDLLATTLREDNRISLRNVATLCDDAVVCGLLHDTLTTEVRARGVEAWAVAATPRYRSSPPMRHLRRLAAA